MQTTFKSYILAIALFSFAHCTIGQTSDRSTENIIAFGKLAGYVQFFSPSDASHQINWKNIYVNGVRSVKNCKNDTELMDSLWAIFSPIEPEIVIRYKDNVRRTFSENQIKGARFKIYKQNRGLEFYTGATKSFQSMRVNRRSPFSDEKMQTIPLLDTVLEQSVDVYFQLKLRIYDDCDLELSDGENILLSHRMTAKDSVVRFPVGNRTGHVSVFMKANEDQRIEISDISFISRDDNIKDNSGVKESAEQNYFISLKGFDHPLYSYEPDITDTCRVTLSENLSCKFPLVAYGNETTTYPFSDLTNCLYTKTKNEKYYTDDGLEYKEVQLGNLLRIWNAFKFSYAYLELSEQEDLDLLKEVVERTLMSKSVDEYRDVLWYMLRSYQDGHIFLTLPPKLEEETAYSIPIDLCKIGNSFYIKDIFEPSYREDFNIGDEILLINGRTAEQVYRQFMDRASGSVHNRAKRAVDWILDGPLHSEIKLTVRPFGKEESEVRTISRIRDEKARFNLMGNSGYLQRENGFIDSNFYYFDLTRNHFDEGLLNDIAKTCKNIIIDMRGYLEDPDMDKIISNFAKDTIMTTRMFDVELYRPDSIVWKGNKEIYYPEQTALSQANIFFLADASTQSAPETLLELFKSFKLGYIVGENTSGANGDINYLQLAGNSSVTYSGIRVVNSDGSKHHNIGVVPDYKVSFSLQDLVKRQDPYIQKVKELVSPGRCLRRSTASVLRAQ